MRLRYLAPSGTPISAAELAAWMGRALGGGDVAAELRAALQRRFGVAHVSLTRTGRAGMVVLLDALKRLAQDRRREVIVPAYTCYSVAASTLKAGLLPRVVDVDPETFDFAPDALARVDTDRVLAVVGTNLYGLPCDMPRLSVFAKERGIFLVDDAAQAMGATIGGRASGTWGDAGLFSFDRGKNVSATNGGALLTQSPDLARLLTALAADLQAASLRTAALDAVGAAAYAALLHPVLYGIPARMPFLGLGATVFTTDYPLERPSRPLTALALTMLPALERLTRQRRDNAARLRAALQPLEGLRFPRPQAGAEPAYLRFPVLMPDQVTRDAAVARLTARGIGASASYPQALVDVEALRPSLPDVPPTPGGRAIASRILTLPTHPFVRAADVRIMADTLGEVMRGRVGAAKAAGGQLVEHTR